MEKRRSKTVLYAGIAVFLSVLMISGTVLADSCCPGEKQGASKKMNHGKHGKHAETAKECPVLDKGKVLERMHAGHFPMVTKSIDNALKALEKGDQKTALIEIKKAKMMMSIIDKMIAKHLEPEFVNVKCPIMGSPINPEKVAKELVRDYKGKKVAFCCAGCPESWDKLSVAEKEAKLAKVKPDKK